MSVKIIPIKTGEIACKQATILETGSQDPIKIPATAWLIQYDGKNVLVDTGMCKKDSEHYPGSTQEESERIDKAVEKLGVNPSEIKTIILTHLHWDHCAHLDKFPNARFYVQKVEYELATKPHPVYFKSYNAEVIGKIPSLNSVDKSRFELLEGEFKLDDVITIFLTDGHVPGHQSVEVKTEKGPYVIAGDAVMCYCNFDKNEKRRTEFTLTGRYWNNIKAYDSIGIILKRAGAKERVLPGHEIKVFEKESYP